MATISSMTGFGRGEAEMRVSKVTFELSSVNRKQFECQLSLPRELKTPWRPSSHTAALPHPAVATSRGALYVAAAPGINSSRLRIDYDLLPPARRVAQAAVRLSCRTICLDDLLSCPTSSHTALPLEPQMPLAASQPAATKRWRGFWQREGGARPRPAATPPSPRTLSNRLPGRTPVHSPIRPAAARLKRFDIPSPGSNRRAWPVGWPSLPTAPTSAKS